MYDYYTEYVRHVRLLFLLESRTASVWRILPQSERPCDGTQYLSDENSLHKFQAVRRIAHRLRRQRWKASERVSGGGGSPINHPLTNCRTGCFARKCPLRAVLRVLAGRLPPRAAPSTFRCWITQEGSRETRSGSGSMQAEEMEDYGVY